MSYIHEIYYYFKVNINGPLEKYDTVSSIAILSQDYDNLIDLESVSEGSILHHIKKRWWLFRNSLLSVSCLRYIVFAPQIFERYNLHSSG